MESFDVEIFAGVVHWWTEHTTATYDETSHTIKWHTHTTTQQPTLSSASTFYFLRSERDVLIIK